MDKVLSNFILGGVPSWLSYHSDFHHLYWTAGKVYGAQIIVPIMYQKCANKCMYQRSKPLLDLWLQSGKDPFVAPPCCPSLSPFLSLFSFFVLLKIIIKINKQIKKVEHDLHNTKGM